MKVTKDHGYAVTPPAGVTGRNAAIFAARCQIANAADARLYETAMRLRPEEGLLTRPGYSENSISRFAEPREISPDVWEVEIEIHISSLPSGEGWTQSRHEVFNLVCLPG